MIYLSFLALLRPNKRAAHADRFRVSSRWPWRVYLARVGKRNSFFRGGFLPEGRQCRPAFYLSESLLGSLWEVASYECDFMLVGEVCSQQLFSS